MTYRVLSTDPGWTFDPSQLELQVATVAKAHGITTQGGWVTFVNGISTTAAAIEVCQGLLRAFTCSNP